MREMETEETIKVRKQDGWLEPGSAGRYGQIWVLNCALTTAAAAANSPTPRVGTHAHERDKPPYKHPDARARRPTAASERRPHQI